MRAPNTRGIAALVAHAVGMLAVAIVTLLASALADDGGTTALLAISLPLAALMLAPFGGFVSPQARAAIAWASLPWALGVGWLAAYVPLGLPFLGRSSVPIAEPSPLAPLTWLWLVPALGLLVGGLRLAFQPRDEDPARSASVRGVMALLAIGLLSNVAASATLSRPSVDEWVDRQDLVLTVPSAEGRRVVSLGEGRVLEVVREVPYSARVWVREEAAAQTPCAWRSDDQGARCPSPVQPGTGDVVVRRFARGWLVSAGTTRDRAIGLDGTPIDVSPVDVAGEVAIPAPLVVAGWLGWLLALALGVWLPRTREHRVASRLGEPWRSYAAFHRAAAALLLVFSQAPLVAARLLGF